MVTRCLSTAKFVDGSGTAFKTINPADEAVLAEVAEADQSDVTLRSPPRAGPLTVRGPDARPRTQQVFVPHRPG